MNIIEAKNLSFKYDEASSHLILDNINLNIEKGSFTAIIGHNGSGKSTFAKHLNAILLPSGGSVYVCGIDTQEKKSVFELKSSLGFGGTVPAVTIYTLSTLVGFMYFV